MKNFFLFAIAAIGLLFFPVASFAAPTANAVHATAVIERTTALQTIWGVVQQEASQGLLDEVTRNELVGLANDATKAVDADDFATADDLIAQIVDIAYQASIPKSKA